MLTFKMDVSGVSLLVVIEYSTIIGEIEIEDIRVYDVGNIEQWNNLAPILDDEVLKDVEVEFYRQLPEPVDGEDE